MSVSPRGLSALRFDGRGNVVETVPFPDRGLLAGIEYGITTDASGNLWFGTGRTVVVVTVAGTARQYEVPLPPMAANVPSEMAAQGPSIEEIGSLARAGDGSILVAVDYSSYLDVLDPSAGTFSQVRLPGGSFFPQVPSGDGGHELATDAQGAIAILAGPAGGGNSAYLLASSDSWRPVASPDSPDGVIDNGSRAVLVVRDEELHPVSSGTAEQTVRPAVPVGLAATMLPSGDIAAADPTGLAVLDPSSGELLQAIDLGTTVLGPSSMPRGTTGPPTTSVVAVTGRIVSADAAGDVWVLTDASPARLLLLPAE